MKSRMRDRAGFSLIELLVVIVIIAILVAILVPALSKARSVAWRVQCLSNQRGIGQAYALYATDHHGSFVPFATVQPGVDCPTGFDRNMSFTVQSHPHDFLAGLGYFAAPTNTDFVDSALSFGGYALPVYAKQTGFMCPEAYSQQTLGMANQARLVTHYGFNRLGGMFTYTSTGITTHSTKWYQNGFYGYPVRIDDVKSPSALIVAGDGRSYPHPHPARSEPVAYPLIDLLIASTGTSASGTPATTENMSLRHNGSPGVLTASGEVIELPDAFKALHDLPGATPVTVTDWGGSSAGLDEVERAARWLHPDPPSIWAY